jgi:hypothetical protein
MPWGCEDDAGFRTCVDSEVKAQNIAAINSVRELASDPSQPRLQTLEVLKRKLESKPAVETASVAAKECRVENAAIWTAEAADAAMKRAGAALEVAAAKLGVPSEQDHESSQLFFPLGSSRTLRH